MSLHSHRQCPSVSSSSKCTVCLLGCLVAQSCLTSLQPYGLYPARVLCPWDSPGKNTGVGCQSFLQGALPHPGIKPRCPALQVDSLLPKPPGKPEKVRDHCNREVESRPSRNITERNSDLCFFNAYRPFIT